MKKFLKSLVLFAAAAMALTSCENEGLNEGIEANDTYTLTFTAGAPESKTSVNITTGSYAWGDNEVVTFLQYANESANKVISNSYEKDVDGKATFGATFNTIEGATTYNHIAIYPSTNYVGTIGDDFSKDKIRVQVPQDQTLTDGNFDPKADLMISKIITTEGAASEALSMEFSRLAAVGVMNLKGVRDGEKISKVTFTIGDNSTKLTGRHTFKFSDGSLYENAYHGYNSVILTATEGNELTAVEAGTPIYFTCLDGKFFGAYSVEVETNLATYTTAADKTLAEEKALVFSAGDVLKFTLNATERVDKDFSIDYSGTYQILTKRTTGNYFYATSDLGTASTKRYQAVDAGSADINSVSTTNENTVWTIEKVADSDKYYVKAGEQYAYWTTGNSANFTENIESAIKFTIDANDDGTYNIHWTASDAERYFALNGSSGSDYFAFYKSGQKQDLQLIPYVVETKTLQSIAVSGQTTEYEVEGTFNFDGTVTATYTGDTTGKTYTQTIAEGYTVSTPDLSQAAESVEVTVTYEGKTATYTITVKEKQQGGESSLIEDTLTTSIIGTEGSYSTWSGKSVNTAVYAGNSMTATGNNSGAIQLRASSSTQEKSGIVTTTSGGKITKVSITNKSGTKVLQVFGKNTAYTSADDLYSDSTKGELLGTITCGTDTELAISGNYAYVGVRSSSGAIYLTDITFTWAIGETPEPTPEIEISVENQNIVNTEVDGTVSVTVTNGEGYEFEANTTADWLEVDWVDGGVYYIAEANTGAERIATVSIYATDYENEKTVEFTITQAAASGGEDDTAYYEKVTEAPADWSGTYLVVYENSSTVGYVFKSNDLTSQTNYTTNTVISSSQIEATSELANYAVVIEKYSTGYAIKSVGGNNYLQGKGSGSNGTNGVASPTIVTTLTLNNDSTVSIVNNTNHFVFNTQGYMRFYKASTASGNGYEKMTLYKLAE